MEWRNGGMADRMTGIAAECQNGGMAEMGNGGMVEWRNGGMAEWWNGGMANGMAEWRNGRRNDGMAVTHGLNLRILTAELGSIPWLSQVLPAEWRNGVMTEWRNGGMADRHVQLLKLDRHTTINLRRHPMNADGVCNAQHNI